jgi:hypothetical protein
VALTALIISILAASFAGLLALYARRADQRASRAKRRLELQGGIESLDAVLGAMRGVEQAAFGDANDPYATRKIAAARERLRTAIDASGFDLPACEEFAKNGDTALLPTAEREVVEAKATIRPWRQ